MIAKIAMIVFFAAFALQAIVTNPVLATIEAVAAGVAAIALALNA